MPETRARFSWKSFLAMFAILVVVVGLLAFFKISQFRAYAGMKFKMPPIAVTSMVVEEQSWQPTLDAVGTVQAVNGVTVSTDLPGIVEQISFESGQPVHRGDLLVKLDTRQEDAQLKSGEARWQLAKANLDRQKELLSKRVSAQSDYDAAIAEYTQAEAAVAETKATIERKMIRASFDGVLGIRQVNLGQYLKSGDPVVPLESLNPIYVNFSLPQQRLADLSVGREVAVQADGLPGETFHGKISSVNAVIDEATRNVMVQATLSNDDEKLRPGMFVNVSVIMPTEKRVLALPATAINYAPYGDSVYVIEKMTGDDGHSYDGVRQQIVTLGASRGDLISVVSGLKAGDEIVTSGGFKLMPHAEVERNNAVQPSKNPGPKPADS
jgi:membrane fusion protein (multidrug efflux system)